jgi:uncharacterized membrane protein
MVDPIKRLSKLKKWQIWATWVAVIATLLLGAEVLWTVGSIWEDLDVWYQLLCITVTFLIVIIFGWRRRPKIV